MSREDSCAAGVRGGAWDLLVVGGGTAGIVAAKTAADARRAADLGVEVDAVRVNFPAVMAHVKAAIAALEPADSAQTLTAAGVEVAHGTATFTGPATASIGGHEVRFWQAAIATGSQPVLPPIPGLDQMRPLTSDTVWSLSALPDRLVVLGGGSIGCELGQAFARLGSKVVIVEAAPGLLAREDPDAAAIIADMLRRDRVGVRTAATVTAVHPADGSGGIVELADGTRVPFDALLVSVGRRPRSKELALDQAGIALDGRGHVRVDRHLRTSNRRVWAAGDVTGHSQFTHTAGVHGSLAASNAILGLRRRVDVTAMPRVTFIHPELAAVGVGTGEAHWHGELRVRTVPGSGVDRAVTDGATDGFTRLVLDRKGRILGATVVGPRAGEALAELVVAVRRGLRARDLASTIHAYPTYSYEAWDAALADVRESLRSGASARAIAALAGARRRWLDLREHD